MRPIEILILAILSLNVLRLLLNGERRWYWAFSAWIGLISIGLHLLLEGSRWQMIPAYLMSLFILISYYTRGRGEVSVPGRSGLRIMGAAALIATTVVSIVLPILLPVPQLQDPSGPFVVGTTSMHLIDHDRADPYAPDPSNPRELMLQIWYPADPTSVDGHAPWMDSAEIVAPKIAGWLNLPPFFLNHLRLAESNSLLKADPLMGEAPYPVLLFSHGYGGFRAQNTNQAQELASYGFIVVGVEHTYGAVVTVFPDGRVADHNPETLPEGLPERESLQATRALGQQWSQDLRFVLDSLLGENPKAQPGLPSGLFNGDNIAAFGHSTGGGAAIEFCAQDIRCDAVLTMDPYLKPVSAETLQNGLDVPALHMFSEAWPGEENTERFLELLESSNPRPTSISIQGTAHYDFSDLPLLSPLAHAIGLKGPLNGERVIEIVNSLSLVFFQNTFGTDGASVLEQAYERFPEVRAFPPE